MQVSASNFCLYILLTLILIQRTDIVFALQYGRPILFFRDSMSEVQITLASSGLSLDRTSAASAIRHNGLDPNLYEILLDVKSLTSLFNNILADLTIDLNTFHEMLVSICCRLIRFHPLQSPRQESNIDAVYHIGLTVFMITLFLQYGGRQTSPYELVSLRLRDVLDGELNELDDDLVLWLMFVGSIWVSGGTDGSWIISKIRRLARRLGINSWAKVQRSVSTFPWISALHDQLGRIVWNSVYQSPQTP